MSDRDREYLKSAAARFLASAAARPATAEERVAFEVLLDLTGRIGFKEVWEGVPPETQSEIFTATLLIVERHLARK